MKTIFKILMILVVAALVGGLFYGAVTASSGTSQSRLDNRQFGRSDRGDRGGGIQFPAEVIKNLAIISLVSVIYLNYSKWIGRKRPAVKVISS